MLFKLWFHSQLFWEHIREVMGNKKGSLHDLLKWNPYMKTNGMCIINIETCTWYYGYKSVYLSSLYTFFTCSWLDLFLSSPLKYGDERKWEWKQVKFVVSEKPSERLVRVAI